MKYHLSPPPSVILPFPVKSILLIINLAQSPGLQYCVVTIIFIFVIEYIFNECKSKLVNGTLKLTWVESSNSPSHQQLYPEIYILLLSIELPFSSRPSIIILALGTRPSSPSSALPVVAGSELVNSASIERY